MQLKFDLDQQYSAFKELLRGNYRTMPAWYVSLSAAECAKKTVPQDGSGRRSL
jgi:hypothetical protein